MKVQQKLFSSASSKQLYCCPRPADGGSFSGSCATDTQAATEEPGETPVCCDGYTKPSPRLGCTQHQMSKVRVDELWVIPLAPLLQCHHIRRQEHVVWPKLERNSWIIQYSYKHKHHVGGIEVPQRERRRDKAFNLYQIQEQGFDNK
ncbi:hypothetical protein NQZ68_029050 [Dissostichus eleginoides]|nr:hypothetical protein NQZ68_029050 [Dissostichus eleginoides]